MKWVLITLKHKWYVLLACMKFGVPLWRALIHDLSKFGRAEMPRYIRQAFGNKKDPKGFANALLHHRRRNAHHWEWWIARGKRNQRDDEIVNGCLPMPETYVDEMIADWIGAERAYPNSQPMAMWLRKNLSQMQLHPKTLQRIRTRLSWLGYEVASYSQAKGDIHEDREFFDLW